MHRAEYYSLRGVIGALHALPWDVACAFGERLGALGYEPFGIRKNVVEQQIAAAFPEFPPDKIHELSRRCFAHLGRTSVETALLPSLGPERIIELVETMDHFDLVQQAMAAGRGVLIITGHLGNWELGGAYLAARGIPLDAIVRSQANPLFDEYINRTRAAAGITIVRDYDAVRRTPRSLRDGRAIAFVADQGVLSLASTYVPFFGRPAKTPRGPAVFAMRYNVPTFFAAALRQPNGRYHIYTEPIPLPQSGDRERDIDAMVAMYTNALERCVRLAPEQYFWHHRRWRRQPPDTPPELRDPVQ